MAWLSCVVSWWLLVSCFGGAVPVWPRGSLPCGLVWCVLVVRSPVLRSVVLCCHAVVCRRALLFVCVVAFVCCFFPAAALSGVCNLGCRAVCSLSSLLCVVLCCAVLVPLRCAVRVVCAVSGAWCCGALLCVVLFPLLCCCAVLDLVACGCPVMVRLGVDVPVWPLGLLPCGWLACCSALPPSVVSSGAVLSWRAVLSCSGVFLQCCVCLLLFFSLKPLQNPKKLFSLFFEKKNYTQPNTPASNKTMYTLLTYMLPVVDGVAVVFVGFYLSW